MAGSFVADFPTSNFNLTLTLILDVYNFPLREIWLAGNMVWSSPSTFILHARKDREYSYPGMLFSHPGIEDLDSLGPLEI